MKFNIEKNSPLPLYAQLQNSIIEKIDNEQYKENSKLPSEVDIIKDSGLSRSTVRQALSNLEKEGYIEKKRGIGTFVSAKKRNLWNLERLRSFREEFSIKGAKGTTTQLNLEKVNTNEVLKGIFGEKMTRFYKLERLRYINGTPSIVVTTYVPIKHVSNLEEYNFSEQSLFEIMEKDFEIEISYAEKEFRAKIVESQDAKLLTVDEYSPIQEVKTTTYNKEGQPIEYSISRDRGDMSVHKVKLTYQDDFD